MQVNILVHKDLSEYKFYIKEGHCIAEELKKNGLMRFPCSRGKCGKCRIYANTIPCDEEIELLGSCNIESGMRLACYTMAKQGLVVIIPKELELKVLTSIVQRPYPYLPIVTEEKIAIEQPNVDDQRSDVRRLLDGVKCKKHSLSLDKLSILPNFIRSNNEGFVYLRSKTIYNYAVASIYYAITIDIGTTISAHLTDLRTKEEILAEHGEPNSQASYGADVISRIQYDMEWRSKKYDGSSPLQHLILEQLNKIIKLFLVKFDLDDVAVISIAGNTTMLHLLCGLPTEHIGKVPFTPVILLDPEFKAKELGLCSEAPVFLLPSISSYVGADIVAAMLAAEVWKCHEPFLLIDIGTNAETILGYKGKFYACSAAAGPCFEGATIQCGVAGQEGAIDNVFFDEKRGLRYSTIGTAPPIGICGSGVLSIIELLLSHNLMDESGYICYDEKNPLSKYIKDDAFYLTDTIFLSQRDIREVQMAKAAVRAGIDSLLLYAGLEEKEINKLFIAGGFGSVISPKCAARIGLFPAHLAEKVISLRNAASMGALRYITEKSAKKKAEDIRNNTKYIELSCDNNFTNFYIDRMQF